MMRFSELLCPTLKEDPSEAEVASHRLMLRSGMIRQVSAGIYSLLPVGLRVIRNVERIVREEMNRAGAQEVLLPAIHPAELWKESGRWDLLGKEMLRLKDRNERDYCFGPTHEEVITDLVRREIRSYRDLPKNFYQIQVKFRDEVRPRFGLMRCREFTMKDAYSFDVDDAGAEASYIRMREAYSRIFERCGLDFCIVDADSGNIGGSLSQEFMVLASSGEDEVIRCTSCGRAANVEKARGKEPPTTPLSSPEKMERKATPGMKTAAEVSKYLNVPQERLLKTLLFRTEKGFFAVLVPGNRDVNEVKLRRALEVDHVTMATPEEVETLTSAPVGFAGPVGLSTRKGGIEKIVADVLLMKGERYVVGANAPDQHWIGAEFGRDFQVDSTADLHRTIAGDLCCNCGGVLESARGIEVGHIFKLGSKYSQAMGAEFTDEQGKRKVSVMGCYGIGIGRTAAAAIEQNHDAFGIVFPPPLAPFQVHIVPIEKERGELFRNAEMLSSALTEEGMEVLLDDRQDSAGRRFKDGDLMGIPVRVTLGEKSHRQGKLEVKLRWNESSEYVAPSELSTWIRDGLSSWKQSSSKGKTR